MSFLALIDKFEFLLKIFVAVSQYNVA